MIAGEEEIHIKPLYQILMKNQCGNIKQCRTLIKHQCVKVNGIIETNMNYLVQQDDVIEVLDKIIHSQPFVYYIMNKPSGYVCANHDTCYPCVTDLLERHDCHCVGRLDKETTGLLLLTNDSSMIKKLLLPQFHVAKKYLVEVQKPLCYELVSIFLQGVIIDGDKQCLPADLVIIDNYHCYVTIHEGKYHQIKKMFLSCQNCVMKLKRVQFAGIDLDDGLKLGEYRELTKAEFQKLKEVMIQ